MGILTKGEKNAYDMLKVIDQMNMKYWLPIGATTLYETCLRLQKKGLIEDTGEAENKAVYCITDAGRKELKKTICDLFERVDYDSVWFCLAVIFSDVLTKKELEAERTEDYDRVSGPLRSNGDFRQSGCGTSGSGQRAVKRADAHGGLL